MAIPTFYQSSDAGAPILNGTVGSAITFLDAILVDGYGSQPAAGWTKLFSGTNEAVYESGNQRVLHVLDDGSRIDARFAIVRGANGATGVSVSDLANPFPPGASLVWPKSTVTNSTARDWMVAATSTQIVFIFSPGENSNFGNEKVWLPFFFGEFPGSIPGDLNRWITTGYDLPSVGSSSSVIFCRTPTTVFFSSGNAAYGPIGGLCASVDGTQSAINGFFNVTCPEGQGGTTVAIGETTGGVVDYPSPSQGDLGISPFYIYSNEADNKAVRGQLPGLYMPLQGVSLVVGGPAPPNTPFDADLGFGLKTYRWIPVTDWFTTFGSGTNLNGSIILDIDSDWAVSV